MKARSGLQIVLVAAGLLLPRSAVTEEISTPLYDTTKVNLTENTYAAADMLAQQTQSRMTPQTPLRIAVLTDVTTPNETTAFGQQVANHLGSRFVQLGYNVQSVPLPPGMMATQAMTAPVALTTGGAPQPVQAGASPSAGKGEVLLTGTYTRMKDTIQVNLKVLQAPDQKIIAAYDYALPMTRDLREVSMSAAERQKRDAQPLSTFMTGP
jgi:hypothetical protein